MFTPKYGRATPEETAKAYQHQVEFLRKVATVKEAIVDFLKDGPKTFVKLEFDFKYHEKDPERALVYEEALRQLWQADHRVMLDHQAGLVGLVSKE